jgi:hypothetical protein
MNDGAERFPTQTETRAAQAAPWGGRPGPRRRFRRRRHSHDEAATQSVPEMLAELVLLREENARLKAAEHEPPSFGRLLSRARSLPAAQVPNEEFADEAAQVLVEVVVLRESLLEVCQELERSMAAVRARLVSIAAVGDDHLGVLAPRSHGSAVVAEQMLDDGMRHGAGGA